MSGKYCLCGERISLSLYPNPQKFKLISESVISDIQDKLDIILSRAEGETISPREIYSIFSHFQTPGVMDIIECPTCGRLYVFARTSDAGAVLWFKLEESAFPEKIRSLSELSEMLTSGNLPVGWQNVDSDNEAIE